MKLYKGKGRHFPKCKNCGEDIVKGMPLLENRGYYYCKKCGEKFINERVAKLEAKMIKWCKKKL